MTVLGKDILGWCGTLWRGNHRCPKNIKGIFFFSPIFLNFKVESKSLIKSIWKKLSNLKSHKTEVILLENAMVIAKDWERGKGIRRGWSGKS